MAELYKCLHHLDILKCDHGGIVELIKSVRDRRTFIESDLKPVCDQDLLKFCFIEKCSIGCRRVVSIEVGFARDDVLKDGAIPLLGNLSATTDKGCIVKWDNSLSAQVAEGEGRFYKKYTDTTGNPTIGQGFKLTKDNARQRITDLGADYDKVMAGTESLNDQQIDKLFADDMVIAENSAKKSITNWDSLSPARQKALTDMAFNMGSFRKFPKFVEAVNNGDWAEAAKQAGTAGDGKSPSLWVKQVGNRALRIIAQIRGDEVYGTPQ